MILWSAAITIVASIAVRAGLKGRGDAPHVGAWRPVRPIDHLPT